MFVTPAFLIALIQNIAVPELVAWLHSRHNAGQPIDDAAILAKLGVDADGGIALFDAWVATHPPA